MRRLPSPPRGVLPIVEVLLIGFLGAMSTIGMFAISNSNLHWVFKILAVLLLLTWVVMLTAIIALKSPRHLFSKEPKDVHWTPDPIVGYRYSIQPLGDREYPGDIPAICRIGQPHRAPSWHCTCGYYAFKTREIAEAYDDDRGFHRPSGLVLCILWGRVIETEKGYRAERMTPVAWVGDFGESYVIVRSTATNAPQLPAIDIHDTEYIQSAIDWTINNLDIEQYQPYDRRQNGHRKTRS